MPEGGILQAFIQMVHHHECNLQWHEHEEMR